MVTHPRLTIAGHFLILKVDFHKFHIITGPWSVRVKLSNDKYGSGVIYVEILFSLMPRRS